MTSIFDYDMIDSTEEGKVKAGRCVCLSLCNFLKFRKSYEERGTGTIKKRFTGSRIRVA